VTKNVKLANTPLAVPAPHVTETPNGPTSTVKTAVISATMGSSETLSPTLVRNVRYPVNHVLKPQINAQHAGKTIWISSTLRIHACLRSALLVTMFNSRPVTMFVLLAVIIVLHVNCQLKLVVLAEVI